MENKKTVVSYLFFPFRYLAGGKALAGGIVTMLLISVLGWLSGTYFNGAIDIHFGSTNSPYLLHLYFQVCNWLVVSVLFYVVIRFLIKNPVRPIDIFGTVALSQLPLVLACLWGFTSFGHILDEMGSGSESMANMMQVLQENLFPIFLTSIVTIIPAIWSIMLKYNAFSICGNVRGGKAVGFFIAIIIVAEILTQVLNHYLVPALI